MIQVHKKVVETWTALKAALSSAPVPAAPAVVHPNILKDVDSEWDTEKSDNIVTCHYRMIGGVLCRWWGDGPEPSGVKKIDAALSSAPVDAPVQAGAGVVDFKKAEQTLCDAVQLLTGWHADIAWTDWDEDVKDRCVDLLKQLGAVVKLQSDLSAPVAPASAGVVESNDPCDYCDTRYCSSHIINKTAGGMACKLDPLKPYKYFIGKRLSSAPVDAPVHAVAGVDALKGLPRYSCGDGHDPCGHGSGLFQTVCGDVFKVADVLAALSQNKEA